jgi:hypothetical protein
MLAAAEISPSLLPDLFYVDDNEPAAPYLARILEGVA